MGKSTRLTHIRSDVNEQAGRLNAGERNSEG
jgi:hypothetical protein